MKKVVFGIFLVVVIGFGVFTYIALLSGSDSSAEAERFIVGRNTSTKEAVNLLHEKQFVKNTWVLNLLLGGTDIEPGGYRISKSMNVLTVASVLKRGPYMKWVTIPEGFRKEQIAELFEEQLGWTEEEKQEWIEVSTTHDQDHIEGVYFPDTYLIALDETPAKVADRLRTKFEEEFAPYATEALNQNIRWTTLLKLASIVQREAAGEEDMPLIAGILWNRLLGNMKLDIDATVQYVRGDIGNGWWAPISLEDKQIDSPYNTYKYSGLPPHPISNPGVAAIAASLDSEETECLYYLHGRDGAIHCSVTYEAHQENIETYLK